MKPNYVTPNDIFNEALRSLGIDASPKDHASDEFGCAETVSDILFNAGCVIPEMLSTLTLDHFLANDKHWMRILTNPEAGDVIVFATGQGNGSIPHGHTGIVMDGENVASNDSNSGKFILNWTISKMLAHYGKVGGYPMHLYRKLADQKPPEPPPITPEETQVVEEAVQVAQKAIVYPSLWGPVRALLTYLENFLLARK